MGQAPVCPCQRRCALFSDTSPMKPFAIKYGAEWWRRFCNSPNHVECARYQRQANGRTIPITLLPNGQDVAQTMDPEADLTR